MTSRAISAATTEKMAATMNALETPEASTWSPHGAGSSPVLRNSSCWAGVASARKRGI